MPVLIGGHVAASGRLTFSWGLSPGSGEIELPGDDAPAVGASVTLTIGGLTFAGVVSANPVRRTGLNGATTSVQLVDNRVKLMNDDVYGTFNNVEVREDNPATPGVDRQKRFWHVLPENWNKQLRTWTDEPYSARQIITFLLQADTVSHSWSASFHSAQSKPVFNVDTAHKGAKLGNVIQEVTEAQGLVFTLVGTSQLKWARKGEGIVPTIPPGDRTDGDALTSNDTQIRVVGDRNRYQDMPIELEPSWVRDYEAFWIESAWMAEVQARFGPFADDVEGAALRKAKALSVTVREYAAKKGVAYEDRGFWGEVSRMEIPVWTYLQDVVWKAYQVPRSYKVNGIPLDSLDLQEGLLAAVTYGVNNGELTLKTPREYYPDEKAFVIAQGQQLALLDPRTGESITESQLANARTLWSACNKFDLDAKNKVLLFEEAVFVPGAGASGLFVFPNAGVTGIAAGDLLARVVVPNAAVTVEPAKVRAVLTWDAEYYNRRFGSGSRKGPRPAPALSYHALMKAGVFTEEVKYADNKGADQKAQEFADSAVLAQSVYRAGNYRRPGAAGTVLTGNIDRVTVSFGFEGGLTEEVDFTRERSGSSFEHERELDRRQRSRELFPGQKNLKAEAEQLRQIAKASRGMSRTTKSYADLNAVLGTPVGAVDCSTVTVALESAKPAGTPIFTDNAGKVDPKGTIFVGVTIAQNASGLAVPCATQGVVPVRVTGAVNVGDSVGLDESVEVAKVGGTRLVGTAMVAHTPQGSASPQGGSSAAAVLIPVRIGGGSGSSGSTEPFEVTYSGPTTGEQPSAKLRVAMDSWLMRSLKASDKLTITGLGSDFSDLRVDQLIWLQVNWDANEVPTATIDHGARSKWPTYDEPMQWDNPTAENKRQIKAFKLLAYSQAVPSPNSFPDRLIVPNGVGGKMQIVQVHTGHLRLCSMCHESDTIQWFVPGAGVGPAVTT